jgi:chromosome segregation ATPase
VEHADFAKSNAMSTIEDEAMQDKADNLAKQLRVTTERMANICSVDMETWNEHSNAALSCADALDSQFAELTKLRKRNAELENELEVSESAHKTKTLMIVERNARIAELEKERDRFHDKCAEVRAQKDDLAEHAQIIEERFATLQSIARQMAEALFFYRDEWTSDVREKRSPSAALLDDAGFKAGAAIGHAASIDLGPDWREEAEILAEALERAPLSEWSDDFEAAAHEVQRGIKATILMTRAAEVRSLVSALADYRAKGGGDVQGD